MLTVSLVTIGCDIEQKLPAFDHVDCIGNEPVAKVTFARPPGWPGGIHAHSSASSDPKLLLRKSLLDQPPAGF